MKGYTPGARQHQGDNASIKLQLLAQSSVGAKFIEGSKHLVPGLHSVVESYFAAPIDLRIDAGRPRKTTEKETVAVGQWNQLACTLEAQVC